MIAFSWYIWPDWPRLGSVFPINPCWISFDYPSSKYTGIQSCALLTNYKPKWCHLLNWACHLSEYKLHPNNKTNAFRDAFGFLKCIREMTAKHIAGVQKSADEYCHPKTSNWIDLFFLFTKIKANRSKRDNYLEQATIAAENKKNVNNLDCEKK